MNHANFRIIDVSEEALLISDEGPWEDYRTVTNDVDWVVAHLCYMGYLKGKQRLFYYDSEGEIAEIVFGEGRFIKFIPMTKEK